MKQRFTSLDLFAIIREFDVLLAHTRLNNIYDHPSLTAKSFLLKFKSAERTVSVVIESGMRMHATESRVDHCNRMPGGFAAKLRKHLRGKRLLSCKQLGFDRVAVMEFHGGPKADTFYLFLEFFAAGNVILTDASKRIISLLRTVELKDSKIAVDEVYDDTRCMQLPAEQPNIKDSSKQALKEAFPVFHAAVIDYLSARQMTSLHAIHAFLASLSPAIIGTKNGQWSDYSPHPLLSESYEAFPSFNAAVDAFYTALSTRREDNRVQEVETEARKKIDAIEREQQGRMAGLEGQCESCLNKAHLLETHLQLMEQALTVCRTALDAGMDWQSFGRVIEEERRRGTPSAQIIAGLSLERGAVTLKLDDTLIEVQVSISAHANITAYYAQRKVLQEKLARTKRANAAAIKSAEAKIRHDLAQTKANQHRLVVMKQVKRAWWFEKFAWFLSSDGYLVLAGRDAQQNEQLVKKYMRPWDIYVHADIAGAGSIVIRNHAGGGAGGLNDAELPPRTMAEAGTASLCQSRAWSAKIVTSAWWVRAEQVSKTAPSGEYLGTGSFMIRGTKNFLPPMPMVYGITFVFVVDDTLRARRREEREQRVGGDEDREMEERSARYLAMIEQQQRSRTPTASEEEEGESSEGGSEEEAEGEQGSMTQHIESDALVLNPRVEDIPHLLYALPMSAPYSTLNRAMVKSKLVPAGGATVKKGKLVKAVVGIAVQDLEDASRYPEGEHRRILKDMIKAVPEQDITHCIPSDAKLAGSAMDIAKAKGKPASKKGNRKK